MERTLFPAYAGMNRYGDRIEKLGWSVPRIRGDEPRASWASMSARRCSPHTRG